MKYLIVFLFLFYSGLSYSQVFGQDRIALDVDLDKIVDSISLDYVGSDEERYDKVRIGFQLSSQQFKPIFSQFITITNGAYFTLLGKEGEVYFFYHLDPMQRMDATFQYDAATKNIILVQMGRSQDGGNDVNGAGGSSLDVLNQTYSGSWSYYDYFEEDPEDYRIYMPDIKIHMSFPKLKLQAIDQSPFLVFYNKCYTLYSKQLDSIYPKGLSKEGYLFTDIDKDYSVDSIFFDAYSGRLGYNEEDEVYSQRLNFVADQYEINKIGKGEFALLSIPKEQEVLFSFDANYQFIIKKETIKNWIDADLDGDGIKDSVKIYWADDEEGLQVRFTYQLSSTNFKEVSTPFYYTEYATASNHRSGFTIDLGYRRGGDTATFRYNKQTKAMQLIGLDSWEGYEQRSLSLNLLTTQFQGELTDYDEGDEPIERAAKARIKLGYIDFASLDEKVFVDFIQQGSTLLDRKIQEQKAKENEPPSDN